jgi:hypothetical protein
MPPKKEPEHKGDDATASTLTTGDSTATRDEKAYHGGNFDGIQSSEFETGINGINVSMKFQQDLQDKTREIPTCLFKKVAVAAIQLSYTTVDTHRSSQPKQQ